MKEWEIWSEGYAATGERGTAHFEGKYIGETFDDAVWAYIQHKQKTDFPDIRKYYTNETRMVECSISDEHPSGRKWQQVHAIWACRLFDNEADARKSFG